MPAAVYLKTATTEGVHIIDPDLNRVVLFSGSSKGRSVRGTISYTLRATANTQHLLFDLPVNQRFSLNVDNGSMRQRVLIVPDTDGSYQASDQGVLDFMLKL